MNDVKERVEGFRGMGRELYDRLQLYTYPVAVRYVGDTAEIPDGFARPGDDGERLYPCTAFHYARRWGDSIAVTREDCGCAVFSAFHRWSGGPSGKTLRDALNGLFGADVDVERHLKENYPELFEDKQAERCGKIAGLMVSPLTEATFVPDAVLVYGNPGQLTHAVHSLGFGGRRVRSSFTGIAESCVKAALLSWLSGEPQMALPGTGDLVRACTGEDEAILGLPGPLLAETVGNLFKSGGDRNPGQPVKVMITRSMDEEITPGWAYLRRVIDGKRGGGGGGR